MKVDYIIRGGRVVDPSTGTDEIRDLYILNSRLVNGSAADVCEGGTAAGAADGTGAGAAGNAAAPVCDHIIDASGCIVTPGLIDFHTHIFHEGSSICIHPDLMIAQGTTAAVDGGSAGTSTFEAFYKSVVAQSLIRVKGFLTLFAGGQLAPRIIEDFDPGLYERDRIERLLERYGDSILGFKIRLSRGVVPEDRAGGYLRAAVELAAEMTDRTGVPLRVSVHTTNPPIPAGEIASILRPGDIFTHCYQGAGSTIAGLGGSIDDRVLEARERGVLFDAANGRGNFGLRCAQRALAAGFLPDIISSDLTVDKFNMPPYAKNLPTILSKYLTLGMSLTDIIRAVTATPAELMGLGGSIGTLRAGAFADVAIFKEKKVPLVHKDYCDDELAGDVLLVPQMTMVNGEIQFCQTDFWL